MACQTLPFIGCAALKSHGQAQRSDLEIQPGYAGFSLNVCGVHGYTYLYSLSENPGCAYQAPGFFYVRRSLPTVSGPALLAGADTQPPSPGQDEHTHF